MTSGDWLLLSAKSFLDNILPILPKLTSVLDAKSVLENILDFLESKTRNLGVEKV